jgi:hypothetical protein
MVGKACGMYMGKVHTGFGGEAEGMRPLGRSRQRWEENILWNFKERGW